MFVDKPTFIIAIGASAGGLEEINTFFDHTPLDSVAYIVVQHLSPDFKSRLAEVISRHSRLTVEEATSGQTVISNHVYLIPADKFMTINGGMLHLTNKKNLKGPHLTINKFFNSLAEDACDKAIGVILSGLGSDGTEGIKNIKKAGGLVIVRDPQSAEFQSMPSHAIATGLVDFISHPERMPAIIEEYVKNSGKLLSGGLKDQESLSSIIEIIKNKTPLDFSDYKKTTIQRRVARRALYNNFTKLSDYLNFLHATPEEIEVLAKDFLISVTSFFRDKPAFKYIEENIIPDILERLEPAEELKVWVAGCATGEEAYSIAILIHEQLVKDHKDIVVKVFATDMDSIALAHAGMGVFDASIENDVSTERLERFFVKEEDSYRIISAIRKMIIFSQHDLVKNPPYCNMHLISCRNVLIYMAPELQKRILAMLLFGLRTHGYLFLGTSENAFTIKQSLEEINQKWKIYRNIETKRTIHYDGFSLPQMSDVRENPYLSIKESGRSNKNVPFTEVIMDKLLDVQKLLIVCVDDNDEIKRTFGNTTNYLLQKNFTLNLLELLPRPLVVAFNALSIKVKKTGTEASLRGINIRSGDKLMAVDLFITPFNVKNVKERLFMVTISPNSMDEAGLENRNFDEKTYGNEYMLLLEEEIKDLKEQLKQTYDQLDRSNENMQSFNEELLSANEEMQSTNEEMQSINEELQTINSEYVAKNKELQELNDDLNNYFRSNIHGQLFVDRDIRLMKFSPAAVQHVHVLPTDIGRPLSDIATNIKFETIVEDIKEVLIQGKVLSKEAESKNGKWFQIVTMPYVQESNKVISGAIVTFNDITLLKKVQGDLDRKNKSLQRINADLENFVHVASHDLLAPLGNIEMSIDLLHNVKDVNPELDQFMAIIDASVKRFRSLINDIATIAKVESESQVSEIVDINEILNNIEWSLENEIIESQAIIKRHLDVQKIYFSKNNLRSILFNLIANSIKFRSDKYPRIDIYTERNGGSTIITLKDNGIGIDEQHLDNIFQLYARVDKNITGHGIGLYLAKKVVDAVGGRISVESTPGHGTIFKIHLKDEFRVLNDPTKLN